MNKTISTNVGGFVFNIEEGAYETLHAYLKAIRRSLSSEEGIDEIMQDVELRIAEIFRDILKRDHKEVINDADVKEIISIMGEPEVYSNEEQGSQHSSGQQTHREDKSEKQFYRDTDDRVLGGVCGGISAYFGWDPLFLRILFVVMFFGFGSGLLLYIVLWIIIPEAKTTTEKLRMRGKKVDVETIKQRFSDFRKDVEHLSGSEGKRKIRETSTRIADAMSDTAKNFYNIFGRVLGTILIIAGLVFLVWLIRAMLSTSFVVNINDGEINDFNFALFGESFFGSETKTNLVFLAVLGFLLMPVIGMLLSGVRLIFRTRFNMKPIGAAMGVVSTAAFIIMLIIGIQTGSDFSKENSLEQISSVNTASDTLVLDVNPDPVFSDYFEDHHEATFELIRINEKTIAFGYPMLDVQTSPDTNFHIEVVRKSRGSSQTEAIYRAKNISYNYSIADSLVRFDPFFVTPKGDLIRGQEIHIRVLVPIGKTVYLSPATDRIIYDIQNVEDLEDEKMTGKYWTMTGEGLSRK